MAHDGMLKTEMQADDSRTTHKTFRDSFEGLEFDFRTANDFPHTLLNQQAYNLQFSCVDVATVTRHVLLEIRGGQMGRATVGRPGHDILVAGTAQARHMA
uniref:Uncharacterized protein n=1 Tax=Oryza australiensis TaxID=4532 RepID=A0A1V1H7T1_9ORYZ|nr:hypothetical protein [Oryza australiensis]